MQEVKEEEQPAVVQLSLASGIMSIMEQQVPNNEIEVVILGVGTERALYDRPFDPDDKAPPDCYAQKLGNDDTFNPTMIPAENVPEPRSDTCANCDLSKMGSADRGKGPACKTRRRMVVAPASVVDNPGALGKQLLLVNVPPTSGRNYSNYVNKIASQGLPPEGVITKISYKPSKKVMFEMHFDPVQPIENEEALAAIFTRAHEFTPLIVGGYSYEQPEGEEGSGSKKY